LHTSSLVKMTLFYLLVCFCWYELTVLKSHSNVFDNRGVGNTTTGIKPFTIQQLANDTVSGQYNAGKAWTTNNWSGVCDDLAKLAKPTLLITGTDDNFYVPLVNSLHTAGKIPGVWLIQIKNAGHAVMSQYPDNVNKILQTFVTITS
jgi:hypothetical protein